jgi:hypothetical protein
LTVHNLSPGGACLLREEHISTFYFGDNIGMSLDFVMMEAFPVDHFANADAIRSKALEADNCVPWRHIALKFVGLNPTLHSLEVTTPRVFMYVPYCTLTVGILAES